MADQTWSSEPEPDPQTELHDALIAVERALGLTPPIGLDRLPPSGRFRAVLVELRSRICSRREEIRARLASDGGELAAVVADVLISSLTQLALPVATVSRRIASMGLDRFCEQPAALLDEQ